MECDMPYLIDGHNLIPKIPGLTLKALNDEHQLIELLQEFCRRQRKQVEVFFDRATPGQAGSQRLGRLTAHFIHGSSSADQAIHHRLLRLGRNAQNWSVVSSDSAVQAAGRAVRAKIIPAEDFAGLLIKTIEDKESRSPEKTDQGLSASEVKEWLHLFGSPEGKS
jgi:predicted RNA-binding protein with PIN domain